MSVPSEPARTQQWRYPAGPVSIKARQRMSPALNIYWSHTEIAESLTISHAPSGRRGLNHFIIVSKTKRTLSERRQEDAHSKIDPYWTGNIQGLRAWKIIIIMIAIIIHDGKLTNAVAVVFYSFHQDGVNRRLHLIWSFKRRNSAHRDLQPCVFSMHKPRMMTPRSPSSPLRRAQGQMLTRLISFKSVIQLDQLIW